ncbi:hypothetical protein [Dokdonella sp.]|uniref:hypothetical protein n=1 Tax=Dokdonella sp. TaxID=2291710 RepID=UPI001B1C7C3B|nr:hypothetical protein [Dokdonella sp.]MBO9663036.1 hypothetical protein [Dokdonella sp.]
MEFALAFYAIFAVAAWCVGLACVVLTGLAARELGARPPTAWIVVGLAAIAFVSPSYLQVVPEPKNAFVILPVPVVLLAQGPAGLAPRWQANLGLACITFAVAYGASRLLLRTDRAE